jgi:hypothetical protein
LPAAVADELMHYSHRHPRSFDGRRSDFVHTVSGASWEADYLKSI